MDPQYYVYYPHLVVESIQPCGEDGCFHPRPLAVVVVYTQHSYLKPIETLRFLRFPNQQWPQFFASGTRCQQHGDPIFGILPAATRISFRDHQLGWQRSEKQPSSGADMLQRLGKMFSFGRKHANLHISSLKYAE